MNQKYVIFGGIAILLLIVIVFVIRKKAPCNCPTCQPKIIPNDVPLNYFYTNEESKLPPVFALRDRETGLFLGLCEDNRTVCLTPSKYLSLSMEDNYVPVVETIYPLLSSTKHRPIKTQDGRYLTLSKDGTQLVIENTSPKTDEDERLRLFSLQQTKFLNNLITKTYQLNGTFGTASRTITILNGNVVAVDVGRISLDERIKTSHLWEVAIVA